MIIRRAMWLPWLVLALTLGVTWLAWEREKRVERTELQNHFDLSLREAVSLIEQRMASHEQILRGVQAHHAATGALGRASFHRYVETLQLDANFAGIQAVGHVAWIPLQDKPAHLAAMRKSGFDDYAIYPEGMREHYAPIIQREPYIGRNRIRPGFDVWSEPIRKQAMERARDSGKPTVTAKVRLATETDPGEQPAFVMYLPLFKPGQPIGTAAERRQHLSGWVYAAFRMTDLMATLYGHRPQGLAFAIHDGIETSEKNLLYRSENWHPATPQTSLINANEYLVIGGHTWTLSMAAQAGFAQRFGHTDAALIAWSGIGLSLLLALAVWLMATARSRALALAATMTQELAENEQRWAFAIEGAGDGVWDRNVQTGETRYSKRWKEMLGYEEEEIPPCHDEWLNRIHPDDKAGVSECMRAYLVGEAPNYVVNYRLRCKNGSYKWMLGRGKIVSRTAEGKPLRMVGTQADITEIKQMESSLATALYAAESANRSKSRFLATMSHEIRTPMNAILGMAQLLQKPELEDGLRQSYVRTILSSGQTLLALLNDILDFSKLEAGKLDLETLAFKPEDIIQGVGTLFKAAIDDKGLHLETHWHGPSQQGYVGDPRRLRQMLSNLVGNAVKFTSQGNIHIEGSECERDAQSAWIEFSVSDSGIGIPGDKQQQLFQAFFQVDSSTTRRYGGTGLGLSIVHGLAKEMGGDVGVESEEGQGARFWFRVRVELGVLPPPSAAATQGDHQETAPSPAQTKLTGRVLLVDDSQINLTLVDAFLDSLGLTTSHAANGQQAIASVCQDEPPDLVLMDIQMPVMDGFAAARQIRLWEQEQQKPRIPIIALTAGVFEDDRKHCLAAGMDGFLAKPVQMTELAQILRTWLKPES